ncbi:MAG: cytochrome c biogenesis protein ResB [Candidatus Eremiobacteraeota bacterium]|nr:cytochrome c biogenesis protein ResB [Candidatus Eremiobacteraeota bacterium]
MAARAGVDTLFNDFVRTWSNVLFAVSLFVIWGILTLLGVVIDQNRDPSTYFSTYAAPLARLILRLGLDNVYHSAAYIGIIALILSSLAVCTFRRVIPARLPPLRPVKIDRLPLHSRIDTPFDAQTTRSRVEAFFRKRRWQIRRRELGGVEWTFADKHDWARFGVLIAHLGFVVIAAGTTIYWARGFSGETAILTGQTVSIPRAATTLMLHDFHYQIQPIATKGGIVYQPVDYVSHVTVAGPDGMPRNATIRVNHPLDVAGTLFYQAAYGFGVRFAVTHYGKPVSALSGQTLKEGDVLTLPQTSRQVQYSQFEGTIDRQTGMPSADPRANDPGVVLNLFDGGDPIATTLVRFGQRVDLGSGFSIIPQRYIMYSGLQYRYDPGIPLVGLGAAVLLAGLCISFYLLPARIHVRVDPAQSGSSVALAATTVKGYDIFESQFAQLAAALPRAINVS